MSCITSVDDNNVIHFSENGCEFLTIGESINDENDTVTISVAGELRTDAIHEFLDELTALSTLGLNIRIDFTNLQYIAQTGQEALLATQQRMDEMGKGTLTVCKVPETIFQQFEKIGLTELIVIE